MQFNVVLMPRPKTARSPAGLTPSQRMSAENRGLVTQKYTIADTKIHVATIEELLTNALSREQVARQVQGLAQSGKLPFISRARALVLIDRIEATWVQEMETRIVKHRAVALRGVQDQIRRAKNGVTRKAEDGSTVVVQRPSFLAESQARDQLHKLIGAYAPINVDVSVKEDSEIAAAVLGLFGGSRVLDLAAAYRAGRTGSRHFLPPGHSKDQPAIVDSPQPSSPTKAR
jgi:hypothetical protein